MDPITIVLAVAGVAVGFGASTVTTKKKLGAASEQADKEVAKAKKEAAKVVDEARKEAAEVADQARKDEANRRKEVKEMEKRFGSDPYTWNWGDMHTLTLTNGTLGESGISLIEELFNRGPFRASGGSNIVNATGWSASESTPEAYTVNSYPSERAIYDLADLNNSIAVHTTGQSGHAYHPNYVDMTPLWAEIKYYPMWWNEQSVFNNAEGHLVLTP